MKRLLKSFKDAGRGLLIAFRHEQNFKLQLLLGILAITAGILLSLRGWEMVLVVLLVFAVLIMELLNTALEHFTDLLKPRLHHYVSVIKDVMAAAVLLTALVALIIGLIIFIPHLINF